MKVIPRWVWGLIVVGIAYFLAAHPQLFAELAVIGFVVVATIFFIGGFFYYLHVYEMIPPWWALIAFGVICFVWPPLFGVVLYCGFIGGIVFFASIGLNLFWNDR